MGKWANAVLFVATDKAASLAGSGSSSQNKKNK
jgi:hypothetical protein